MKITSLSPTRGPVGTHVTITGEGFGATQGRGTVAFNGMPVTPSQWTDRHIAVSVPGGATDGPVVVQVVNAEGRSVEEGAGKFTVLPPGAESLALEARVAALEARLPQRDPITGLDLVPAAKV